MNLKIEYFSFNYLFIIMNLVYLLPLLSRPDKQSVKEELSKAIFH